MAHSVSESKETVGETSQSSVIERDRLIEIEPFKRTRFDRGTKKIIVNGEQWGWFEMTSHGSQGTTYHLQDMHGPVERPSESRANVTRPITHRPDNKRHLRIANIGKPEHEQVNPPKIEDTLVNVVRKAIEDGHMRSPETRNKDLRDESTRYAASIRRANEAAEKKLSDKAATIVAAGSTICNGRPVGVHFLDAAALKQTIIDAMKWAQTQ